MHWSKFELIEPSEDVGEDGEDTASTPSRHAPAGEEPREPAFHEDPNTALSRPVGQRMARTVDGVRASLERLRAHVAAKSIAEAQDQADQAAVVDTEGDPEAVCHPSRFSGPRPEAGRDENPRARGRRMS